MFLRPALLIALGAAAASAQAPVAVRGLVYDSLRGKPIAGALVAAILGMNFRLGVFESTTYFWVVLAGIGAIAALTLVAARVRHWI